LMLGIFLFRGGPWDFQIGRHVRWQQMKLLHLGSPSDQLRTLEHAGVVKGANLDEDSARRAFGMRRQVDSTGRAEGPCRRSGKVLLVEGTWGALGKLE